MNTIRSQCELQRGDKMHMNK